MKLTKFIIAAGVVGVLGFFSVDGANAQTPVLVQTQTGDWATSRDVMIRGEVLSGFNTNGVTGTTYVNQYTGVLNLSRVVIKIAQPVPSQDPVIAASISIDSGSTTFSSSATSNRITENTAFLGSSVSVYDAVVTAGGDINDYNKTKVSANYANTTLTAPDTLSRSVDTTQSSVTLFDSSNYTISSADLNSIFRGLSNIGFDYSITSSFYFSRDNTTGLTATLTGQNSGRITVEYYAVPEPSSIALLLGAGAVGAVIIIRRRRAAGEA